MGSVECIQHHTHSTDPMLLGTASIWRTDLVETLAIVAVDFFSSAWSEQTNVRASEWVEAGWGEKDPTATQPTETTIFTSEEFRKTENF